MDIMSFSHTMPNFKENVTAMKMQIMLTDGNNQ